MRPVAATRLHPRKHRGASRQADVRSLCRSPRDRLATSQLRGPRGGRTEPALGRNALPCRTCAQRRPVTADADWELAHAHDVRDSVVPLRRRSGSLAPSGPSARYDGSLATRAHHAVVRRQWRARPSAPLDSRRTARTPPVLRSRDDTFGPTPSVVPSPQCDHIAIDQELKIAPDALIRVATDRRAHVRVMVPELRPGSSTKFSEVGKPSRAEPLTGVLRIAHCASPAPAPLVRRVPMQECGPRRGRVLLSFVPSGRELRTGAETPASVEKEQPAGSRASCRPRSSL
jgi:hypothetical protein